MKSNEDRVLEVEKIVDASTLLDTLSALELMCDEKASHVREAWRDETLANRWEACAKAIYKANVTVAKHDPQ